MTSLEFEMCRHQGKDGGPQMLAGVLLLLASAFVALGFISWRLFA